MFAGFFLISLLAKMLSSSLRKCVYHEKIIPRDFLLRLTRAEVPGTSKVVMTCDVGLSGKKMGKGKYVQARKSVVEALYKDGRYNYVAQGAFYRADMAKHIGCLLATKSLSFLKSTLKQSRFSNRMSWVQSHRKPGDQGSIHIDLEKNPVPKEWIYEASKGGVLVQGKVASGAILMEIQPEDLQFLIRFPKDSLTSVTPTQETEVKYQSSMSSIENVSELLEYQDVQFLNEDGSIFTQQMNIINAARLYSDQLDFVVKELQIDIGKNSEDIIIGIIKSPDTVNWAVSMLQIENYYK
ncbi:hypothetical protein K7432_012975 [Basidiobolus ranarum]|uniref:Ribosomal protein L9 n=1 Tax=Basidiobolus ranarum TaxID=34480 RepID=A0ABR2VSD1_9FUNG